MLAVKVINRIYNSVLELFIKGGNLRVEGDSITEGNALAKVNNISNVYLGCPIGTIVTYLSNAEPFGWKICNGNKICNLESGTSSDYDVILRYQGTASYKKIPSGFEDYKNLILLLYNNKEVSYSQIQNGDVYLPDFKKKFLLGAETGSTIGKDSNDQPWSTDLGKEGGAATQILKWNNIENVTSDVSGDYSGLRYESNRSSRDTQPGNNIPPFIAVNFIIKYK